MTKIKNRNGRQVVRNLPGALPGRHRQRKKSRTSTSSSRPDFFDLIVVDECHRGSAAEDSAWREILEYFTSATQIGLTATPRKPRTFPTSTTSASRSTPTRSSRASPTVSSRPTKWSASTSTRISRAGGPSKARRDKYGEVIDDRDLQPARLRPQPGARKAHRAGRRARSPSSSRPPTASPRPSSSARTSTTPSGCARRWSTRTRIWPPPTASTSCASPATTTRARPNSTTSSIPESRYPGHRHHLAS